MNRVLLCTVAALFPTVAMCQTTVPALVSAQASASAGMAPAAPTSGRVTKVEAPPGMPPTVQHLSPSARLNIKERDSARMAAHWRNRPEPPSHGADGVQLWAFGASLPSIVCAPLEVCDLALQPGEIVNNINLGDKIRWSVMPAVSGFGAARVTHLVIKPQDAGLVTSMLIFTDKRTYSIKLISTRYKWTPLTAFSYPEDNQAAAWNEYRKDVPAISHGSGSPPAGPTAKVAALNFDFRVSGDHPSWRPDHVYSDGRKTYIHFPTAMRFSDAPALVGLASDGGWFRSPSEQMINYRVDGNTYVVDSTLNRAELVMGVGSSQQKVLIERER